MGAVKHDTHDMYLRLIFGFGFLKEKARKKGKAVVLWWWWLLLSFRRVKRGLISGFMSAEFDLALIGAQLQLWLSSSSTTKVVCSPSHLFFTTALLAVSCMILCFFRQRLILFFHTISMRLRPKRTCSGVECFGSFHIKQRFFYLFLYLRGAHT
ncbi:hypothetical protein REPUB_Repub04eG0258500 [Reevesia pubescens]